MSASATPSSLHAALSRSDDFGGAGSTVSISSSGSGQFDDAAGDDTHPRHASAAAVAAAQHEDVVPFVAGNPSIQLTRGVIHVFKRGTAPPTGAASHEDALLEATAGDDEALPPNRIPLLLVPAIPYHVTHAHLLDLLGEFAFDVWHVRAVRGDSDADAYMALLRFNSQGAADRWRRAVLGKPFSGRDGPRISVFYVSRVTLVRRGARLFPHDGAVELPNCVICLERMDSSVTGVMTTQCGHQFHCACLAQWADVQQHQPRRARDLSEGWKVVGSGGKVAPVAASDAAAAPEKPQALAVSSKRAVASSCPVCRFAQKNALETKMACSVAGCNVTTQLWTCLVCAKVNCGRAANKHALAHFHETGHAFSLEIGTGRIWSYQGDSYVHRLMHVAAENVTQARTVSAAAPERAAAATAKPDKALNKSLDGEDEVFDKADAIEAEYTFLLTSQLAAQRRHFEQRLEAIEQLAHKQMDQLHDENEHLRLASAQHAKQLAKLEATLAASEAAREAADDDAKRRVHTASAEKRGAERTAAQTKKALEASMAQATALQRQLTEAQARIKELDEELSDMRFALTMSDKVANDAELQGAQIAVVPPTKVTPTKRAPRGSPRHQ